MLVLKGLAAKISCSGPFLTGRFTDRRLRTETPSQSEELIAQGLLTQCGDLTGGLQNLRKFVLAIFL